MPPESTDNSGQTKGNAGQQSTTRNSVRIGVLSIAILLLGIFILYPWNETSQEKPEFSSQPSCFVNSTTMIEQMKDALNLHTQNAPGVYYLIEGPHGSGKTTALKYAAKALDDNIIYYVTVDHSHDFSMSLANALPIVDLGCEESLASKTKKECPETLEGRVKSCLSELEAALKQMQKEGNPSPILIIDHVNVLLDGNAPILFTLQAFAKRMADEHLLTIYFVSSEGKMYRIFRQRSVASRMVLFPLYIWDLPYEKALKYLHCLCKFADNNTIADVIDFVGGRFSHILSASAVLQQLWENDTGVNIMDMKNKLFQNVIGDLQALTISKTPPTDKSSNDVSIVTWSLAKKIIATTNNTISLEEADDTLENLSEKEREELREANIFYFDWINQEVAFQSTLVHSYFKNAFEKMKASSDEADQEPQNR